MIDEDKIKKEIQEMSGAPNYMTMEAVSLLISIKYNVSQFSVYWWPRKNFEKGYLQEELEWRKVVLSDMKEIYLWVKQLTEFVIVLAIMEIVIMCFIIFRK